MFVSNLKSRLTTVYLAFLVVYLIIRDITPLQFLIQSTVLSLAVFGVGFALIVWDLLTDANCLKGKATDFFVAFILICVLSSIINIKYGFAGNVKCIGAMVLEILVLFSAGAGKERDKNLKVILNTLNITMFIFVVLSVCMYIFSIDYMTATTQTAGDQGFDTAYGRLWGVFVEPNVSSYVCLLSFFSSFYLMYRYKKIWAYIIYSINALFQMLFIMLSMSRSALLIMMIIPLISALYLFLCFFKKSLKKTFCSILIAIGLSASLFGLYQGLNYGMPYVKSAILKSVGVEGRDTIVTAYDNFYIWGGVKILNIEDNHILKEENLSTEVEEIERKDEKSDYSNGRFARWNGGFQVFKVTPLFGTSPRNYAEVAKEKTPDTVMGKYGWVAHCSYLDVFVCSGVFGALALFGGLIYILTKLIKSALKNGFNFTTYVVFLLFLTVAAGVFFVSDVFFVFTINSLLFFFMLGFIYADSEHAENSILYRFFTLFKGRFFNEKNIDIRS